MRTDNSTFLEDINTTAVRRYQCKIRGQNAKTNIFFTCLGGGTLGQRCSKWFCYQNDAPSQQMCVYKNMSDIRHSKV